MNKNEHIARCNKYYLTEN